MSSSSLEAASHAAVDNEGPSSPLVIHEQQNLQLCAIHTVNNLLQLSTNNEKGWMCGSQRLNPSWSLATKSEFDAIADELTVAENELLGGEGQDETTKLPSLYQKLYSQHRTMVFGNYSSEVMQTVLKKRGVELSWYNPKDESSILHVEDPDTIVLGFIVNEVKEESFMGESYLARIPFIGEWFGSGRHWYSITRLERGSTENNGSTTTEKNSKEWKVLDSLSDKVEFLESEQAVADCLRDVITENGAVFRATTRL